MFDIAWSELLIVAVVAILVVGPKELPALLRTLGQMMGKVRRTADEFKRQFDEAVKEAGAEDLQREIRAIQDNNPLTQLRDQLDELARDPMKPDTPASKSPQTGAGQADASFDDVAPPPPLPPRDAGAASGGVASPQGGASTSSSAPAGEPPAASPAKEAAGNGAHDQRLNGEHRPAS